jgi:signal transduction histidine kinase
MRVDLAQETDTQNMAGRLALELMHEIRNPLEALSYLTYLTSQEADNPEQVRKYIEMAQEQVEILTEISSQTLGLAQPTATLRSHDLVELVETALRIHRRTIDGKKIHLVKKFPEQLTAGMYKIEMLQVLWNLIGNALQAVPDEGTLCLRIRKSEGRAHLIVADNGHGIAKEHAESIFEPFFTTKGEEGSGLGLALSRRLVDHHKGTLRMRSSVREGKSGTSFKVCFPCDVSA